VKLTFKFVSSNFEYRDIVEDWCTYITVNLAFKYVIVNFEYKNIEDGCKKYIRYKKIGCLLWTKKMKI